MSTLKSTNLPIIGIIGGKGQMGSVFAEFFREQNFPVLISDQRTSLTNRALAQKADVVIISVPIEKTLGVIKSIALHVLPSSLFMDLTSIKEKPVQAMLASKASVIGLHPMFNGSTFGQGQTIVYCPARPGKWEAWLKKTLGEQGGFDLVKCTPQKHDEQMAMAQVLIHFTEIALGKALYDLKANRNTLMRFASPSSRLQLQLAARHLAQDPGLYGNIQIQNINSGWVLEYYANAVETLRQMVHTGDLEVFKKYFKEGAEWFGEFGKEALMETDHILMEMTPRKNQNENSAEPVQVATLGPAWSHSALAAEQWLTQNLANPSNSYSNIIAHHPTIGAVVEAVLKGKVKQGIVPVENRLVGTVRETLDAIFQKKVYIIGAFKRPIHHVLAILPQAKSGAITAIVSHEQALNQCRHFLEKKFPKANWKMTPSTTAAFEDALRRKDFRTAVVGTAEAAHHFGFEILQKNIENDPHNETCFWVLAKQPISVKAMAQAIAKPLTQSKSPSSRLKTSVLKTSVIFYFARNKAGSLFSVFQIFADLGINLSRIESRPTGKKFGEYLFYLDFDADARRGMGKKAMQKLKTVTSKIQWLGTY